MSEKGKITSGPTHMLGRRGTVLGLFFIGHFYIQR